MEKRKLLLRGQRYTLHKKKRYLHRHCRSHWNKKKCQIMNQNNDYVKKKNIGLMKDELD